MSELGWILLAAGAAFVGLLAIQFIVVLVRLLQAPVRPLRLLPVDVPPALTPHQRAAVAELEALGFGAALWSELEVGERRVHGVLLQHESVPAFAELTFHIAGSGSSYAVAFHSFLADGRRLITTNRTAWALLAVDPTAEIADSYADDVTAQWQAHQARLQGRPVIAVELAEARRVLAERIEAYFDQLRDAGAIRAVGREWHYTLRAAAQIARAWFKVRKRLARPYQSAASSGEHETEFFAQFYVQMEQMQQGQVSRRDVKAWVLGLSAVVSTIGWGVAFGWMQAVALVGIIFVHESGHALAMRAFGYRNMHMFFVPFVGAIVTGVPRETAAWKQTLVLLAGPVPGLLAGVAGLIYFDQPGSWQMVAVMAVWINLFNLLPITPLDGGQLMELALFSRWPRARMVFVAASVVAFFGLALWIKSPAMWVLAIVLLSTMIGQWRIARLHGAWREELDHAQQVAHLFDFARRNFRLRGIARQYALVKGALTLRRVGRPRLWESALVITLMAGMWSAVAVVVFDRPAVAAASVERETRSAEQIAFDEAYWIYLDEESGADGLAALAVTARALDPADPRLVDLEVERSLAATEPARRTALEAILAHGRDGLSYPVTAVAHTMLDEEYYGPAAEMAPLQRATYLQRRVDRLVQLAPRAADGTVDARLRIAEAYDAAGERTRAIALLDELDRTTKDKTERTEVVQARAWFHLSHHETAAAIDWLDRSTEAEALHTPGGPLAITYAWALLAAGRSAEGLEQMQLATQRPARKLTLMQRLRGVPRERRPIKPIDLAAALLQTGHEREARAVLQQSSWECWRARDTADAGHSTFPWQEMRERAQRETAKALCATPMPTCQTN